MKLNPIRRLRRAVYLLHSRASASVKHFGRHTDEVLSEEPIDFSSPSIPYYENLANRMSFVRVVLYMVLLVFVVVTVISNRTLITYENLYYLAKDIEAATLTAQSEADHMSYPISSADTDFAPYRGGLVIAGGEVVTAISGSGKQTLSVNVDYATPVVRASEKYFLTFGRGENSFAVYNSFVQVHRESTEFPVFDAAVADNGTFAILTRSRDYTSEVVLYDSNMEKVATHHIGGYVTGMALNASGTCLGVVSVESKAGVWETRITLTRIERKITNESVQSVTLTGTLGSACDFTTDERLAVILSDRLLLLKKDATITREVSFEGRKALLGCISDGHIAILTRNGDDHASDRLAAYDRNGNALYEMPLPANHPIRIAGGADSMLFEGNTLYVRASNTLFAVDENGKTVRSASISRDTLAICPLNGRLLVCTPAYATRLTRGDFQ